MRLHSSSSVSAPAEGGIGGYKGEGEAEEEEDEEEGRFWTVSAFKGSK